MDLLHQWSPLIFEDQWQQNGEGRKMIGKAEEDLDVFENDGFIVDDAEDDEEEEGENKKQAQKKKKERLLLIPTLLCIFIHLHCVFITVCFCYSFSGNH